MTSAGPSRHGVDMEVFRAAQSLTIDWKSVLDPDTYSLLTSCCRELECAIDTLTLPFLTLVATQMGVTLCKVNGDWSEQLRLRCLLAARRGEKKTTVCKRFRREINSRLRDENANSDTFQNIETKIYSLEELQTKDEGDKSKTKIKPLVMIDDFESVMKKPHLSVSLENIFDSQVVTNDVVHMVGMCQAQNIFKIINETDTVAKTVDTLTVCCAADSHFMESNHHQHSPMLQVLTAIQKAHSDKYNEYTLDQNAELEFNQIRQSLHNVKLRYSEDEVRWGCINRTAGHVIQFGAILQALRNTKNEETDRQSKTIGIQAMKRSFILVLQLLRHKFMLLPQSFQTSEIDFVELLYLKEVHDLKVSQRQFDFQRTSNDQNQDDVIEITLDVNDEPVARIIPTSVANINSDIRASDSSDVHLLRAGYTNHNTVVQNEEHYHDNVNVTDSIHAQDISDQNDDMSRSSMQSESIPNQPIFPDRLMIAKVESPQEAQPVYKPNTLPPPLKMKPSQPVIPSKFKSLAQKRVVERVRMNKNDIYTCSDELFVHQCTMKIKKCMLIHGNIITSSYACQYRLFPPVPLIQRTSSPRTTHPSWAAVKFFERLQKLGLGEVLVFRSQSIKFRKKPYDEMSEETRKLLRTVGVEEEDYREAMGKANEFGIRPGSRDYHEYATMVQSGVFNQNK